MASLDIFNNDAFSVMALTDTIVDIPVVPTLIGSMGLFQESGMMYPSMGIERKGSSLSLVPAAPRGGVAQNTSSDNRVMINLAATHLPQKDTIMADQVYGVRAFGKDTEVMGVMELVTEKMVLHRANIDLTLEYHRIGAIKGQVLDTDGSVLLNMYTAFGMSQTTQDWNIATASTTIDPIALMQTLKRGIKAKLGGRAYRGVMVLCSLGFFDKFTMHDKMKAAWDKWNDGAYLRTDQSARGDFAFGDVTFRIYEGGTSAGDFIPADEAYAFPIGVPGMFQTKYAPGNMMSVVNTMGKPFYASQRRLDHDVGIELFSQSNPLNFNMFPEAVFRLRTQAP